MVLSLKDRIIECLKVDSYLSDRELADKLLGKNSPQQSINQACRLLQQQGVIRRTLPPIKNYLADNASIEVPKSIAQPAAIKTDSTNEMHEDAIKAILNDYLIANGWETKVAWGKTHGIDVEAFKGTKRWIIEAKGCGSLNPMRVNYFLSIIGETLQRMDDPNARYSIALPDIKQYRNLWDRLPELAKQRTMIDIIFVKSQDEIEFVK